MKKFVAFIAAGFGLGYSPVASGTFGSLLGIPIIFFLCSISLTWQIGVCVGLVLIAIPICGVAEDYYDTTDDGRIVADEFMTLPICMIGLPFTLTNPWMMVTAFLTCRFFDIIKLPPARQCEQLSGGLGVVMDDVVASLMSLGTNHLLFWVVWPIVKPYLF